MQDPGYAGSDFFIVHFQFFNARRSDGVIARRTFSPTRRSADHVGTSRLSIGLPRSLHSLAMTRPLKKRFSRQAAQTRIRYPKACRP
jgi:hypothetical protein